MKKLITFLDAGKYENVFYSYNDKKVYTKFVQEAVCNIVGSDTQVIIFIFKKNACIGEIKNSCPDYWIDDNI